MHQGNSAETQTKPTGRTIGDILDSVLERPRRAVALVLLLAAVLALCLGAAWVVARMFDLQASEVTVGPENARVVFQSVQKRTGNADYVVVVSPQGWQNTGIDVSSGDKITFFAGGKICIDMDSVWEKVHLRLKYENEIAKAKDIRHDDPTEMRVPEDYFTDEQKRSLILNRPWVDPDGFDLNVFEPSFRSRRNRYLLPDKPAGGLVGALRPGAKEPDRTEAFFIGKMSDYVAPRDGQLWLTVNDVQYNDPKNPNLFYNDNIGMFWARITVKKNK
jgi:hypothetical protein